MKALTIEDFVRAEKIRNMQAELYELLDEMYQELYFGTEKGKGDTGRGRQE